MKQTWKHINQVLQSKRKENNFPNKFTLNGLTITNKQEIADAFNKYFVDIGPELANKIPTDTIQNPNSMPNLDLRDTFFLTPTTENEIYSIINNLKPKTSTGIDEISCKLIKQSCNIIPALTYIINLSMERGHVPEDMKLAKVIPIYKNKEKDNLQNYRPISLLPAFSKILENVIYKRLYAYFNAKKLFFLTQDVFRENHSTELAVIEFQDLIIKNKE